jgi:N-acetylneuraminate synthase
MAHAFIDAIARTGADAVKFQTHIAAAESTPAEPWRVEFSRQDATRYNYWKRMEFTEEQWIGLKSHAEDRGLTFLSSPFSLEAVNLLDRIGVPMWKIPSGEASASPMLDRILATHRPVLLSTGLSTLEEVDAVVGKVKTRGVPLTVLQCTTAYPCPPEKVGLNMLQTYRERYGCPVGLSDHSGAIYAGLAAVALGAEVVEVHVALSREMFGPDVIASVTTTELRQLVEGVRFIEKMMSSPLDKDAEAEFLAPMRRVFGKSIVARTLLAAGTILTEEHLALKKPGTGLHAERLPDILGRRTRRTIQPDEQIQEGDTEQETA